MKIKEWWAKLRSKPVTDVIKHKHRFVVMDTDTFKEKFSFQLSGINLFVTIGITVIVFILLTTVLIAFTPLREWIPGYTDNAMVEQTYANARKIDSLETLLSEQEWMVGTIQAVLSGKEMGHEADSLLADTSSTLQQMAAVYRRSEEDSLLRLEVEREDNRYEVKTSSTVSVPNAESSPALSHLFYPPLKGKIPSMLPADILASTFPALPDSLSTPLMEALWFRPSSRPMRAMLLLFSIQATSSLYIATPTCSSSIRATPSGRASRWLMWALRACKSRDLICILRCGLMGRLSTPRNISRSTNQ